MLERTRHNKRSSFGRGKSRGVERGIRARKLELKMLPDHLKYVFLKEGGNKHVIISNSFSSHEEKKLIQVLRENQKEIGWVLSDLKGISPSYYMHKIMMEENRRTFSFVIYK